MNPSLHLGFGQLLGDPARSGPIVLPAHHLVTHGVVVGMTGSGKTGLVTVLIEEALRASIPVLVVDVKGDLPNLTLAFPSFDAASIAPWIEPGPSSEPPLETAARLASERERGL